MTQYNLIHIGAIQSNITSGVGNRALSNDELLSLYDGNTTSSGVGLVGTDVLCLDIDMGYRLRLDSVKLYIDVPGDRATALTNVEFYYKNNDVDAYSLCSKDYNSTIFYTVGMPSLFAPRYLRVVISGQESTIYELVLLNDDTQVSFGETGGETLILLNQTLGGYTEVGIFNNSPVGSQTVNAYVIVDYQGQASDYYVKLANNADGPYYGLGDGGVELSDNDLSKTYHWSSGTMDGTTSDTINNTLINNNTSVGYYTSPVFDIEDKLNNTFILTDIALVSGTSITWGGPFPGGSTYLRSSNEPPVPFNKFFWAHSDTDDRSVIYVGDMSNGYVDGNYYTIFTSAAEEVVEIKADRWRAKLYVLCKNTYNQYCIRRYDYKDKVSEDYSSFSTENKLNFWDLDSIGCVWGYVELNGYRLVRFDYDLLNSTTMKESDTSNFLGGLSACKYFPSCWYTDTAQNKLVHVDYLGETIASINITEPGSVTSLPDGGCFAVSHGLSAIIRYDYYGNEVSTIAYSSILTVNALSFGVHGGNTQPFDVTRFWLVINSSNVIQMDYNGTSISDTSISNVSAIEAFPGGCLVFREAFNTTIQLNAYGEVSYVWDFSTYAVKGGIPYPVTIYYDEYLTMTDISNILPTSTDPIWGTNTNWTEVVIDGCKLPFYRYHQLKFKLIPGSITPVVLINPGAETGTMTGWTQETISSTFSITSSEHYSGTYSFKTGYLNSALSQTIDVTTISGTDSTLFLSDGYFAYATAMIKSPSNSVYLAGIYDTALCLTFFNGTMDIIGDYRTDAIIASSWHQFQLCTMIPNGTRYIKIKLFLQGGSNASFVSWFDDVKLEIFRTSSLNKVMIPAPLIINDIQPQEFKNVYVKTDIPPDAPYGEYTTSLKCWWGNVV